MKYTKLSSISSIPFCIRLEKGEELLTSITKFCQKNKIFAGSFQGIGATNNLTIGLFNPIKKQYSYKQYKRPLEILSIVGNISTVNNKPFVHAHIVAGPINNATIGGHVKECTISLTCEIYLHQYKTNIKRMSNKTLGISILKLQNKIS